MTDESTAPLDWNEEQKKKPEETGTPSTHSLQYRRSPIILKFKDVSGRIHDAEFHCSYFQSYLFILFYLVQKGLFAEKLANVFYM